MKVEDNRVVEATKLELFDLFVEQEWYYIVDIMGTMLSTSMMKVGILVFLKILNV